MRTWALLLSGLVVWAIHFFTLYIVASIFPTTPLAHGLALLATLLCLCAVAFLILKVRGDQAAAAMDRWVRAVAFSGLGLSGVAILWQGMPAFFL